MSRATFTSPLKLMYLFAFFLLSAFVSAAEDETTQRTHATTKAHSPSQTAIPSSEDDNDDDSGLSKGAIAGIVLGGLVVIALVLVGALFLLKRAHKRKESREASKDMEGARVPQGDYSYSPMGHQSGSSENVASQNGRDRNKGSRLGGGSSGQLTF